MKYFICLGSNLGKKRKNLKTALFQLEKEGVRVLCYSSIYKTQPVGICNQSWFYNQVVEIETDLLPLSLLRLIKKIEKKMGRQISIQKGPRLIDIDILLAGNTVIRTKELVIPHPRLAERNFVLIPLREISPETEHPVLKAKIEDLEKKSKDPSIVEKLE